MNHSNAIVVTKDEFNTAAESFYRDVLRKHHIEEAIDLLHDDLKNMQNTQNGAYLHSILNGKGIAEFMTLIKREIMEENACLPTLERVIHLILLTIDCDIRRLGAD